jgi:hypothetical protein
MSSERFVAAPLPAADAATIARVITAPMDIVVGPDTSALGRAFAANLERLGRARIVGPAARQRRSA